MSTPGESDRATDTISRLEDSLYAGEFFTSVRTADGKTEEVKPLLEAIFWVKKSGIISESQAVELVKEYAQASKTRGTKFNVLAIYALKKAAVSKDDIEKVVEILNLDVNDKLMWAEDFKAILGADSHVWKRDFEPAIEAYKKVPSSLLSPTQPNQPAPASRFGRSAKIATGVAALAAAAIATVSFSNKPSVKPSPSTKTPNVTATAGFQSLLPKAPTVEKPRIPTPPAPVTAKAPVIVEAPIQPAPQPEAPVAEAPVQPATPVAVEAAPSSVSLPLLTKENGHGGILFDAAASKEAWIKLGFTVTSQFTPEGKRFYLLKDANGNEFIANIPTRLGEQTTIEATRS